MNLSNLKKETSKKKKRVGRGYGSGKAKTAGRGTKGQKARGKVKLYFEGGQLPLIRRLPLKRGKDKFKPLGKKPMVVNVKYLDLLPEGIVVDEKNLIKYKIIKDIDKKSAGIKILGDGEVKKKFIVKLPCSAGAKAKIEKAGGSVEFQKKDSKGEEVKRGSDLPSGKKRSKLEKTEKK